MIEITATDLSPQAVHALLTHIVVPRPIAWVSTLDEAGAANLAPHSFFNVVSTSPPVVMFSAGHTSKHNADKRKDTVRNIERTKEFTLNLVTEDLLEQMNTTAAEVPPDVDEFVLAGVTKAPAFQVKPFRVKEAKAVLECRLREFLRVENNTVVFGNVVALAVSEEIYVDNRIDAAKLRPVGRLGGLLYSLQGELLSLKRPDPAKR